MSAPWATWKNRVDETPRKGQTTLTLGEPRRRRLPLWESWNPGLDTVHATAAQIRTEGCTRCASYTKSPNVCLGPRAWDADARGKPMIVLPQPTRDEAHGNKAFSAISSVYLQRLVEKFHPAGVGMTYAIGCAVGADTSEAAVACRPYFLNDILEARPERLILIGAAAIQAAFGRFVDTSFNRRGWGMVRGVPAFLLGDHRSGFRNRFVRSVFEKDFEWALNAPLPQAPTGYTDVPEFDEATQTLRDMHTSFLSDNPPPALVVDVEHAGSLWGPGFHLLCIGLGTSPHQAVVLKQAVLTYPIVQAALKALLEDPRVPKVNVNIKHDRHAIYRQFGIDMRGVARDLMLWGRLREPEAKAGLGPMSWAVGYGGYKEASKSGEQDEDDKGGNRFANMSPNSLHAYNGRDVAATLLLDRWFDRAMPAKQKDTWARLIGPAFEMLGHVERNGMALSPDNVRAYDLHLFQKEADCVRRLKEVPQVPREWLEPRASTKSKSPEVNIKDSEKAQLLYDILKLPVLSKTATGRPSVDADTLEKLAQQHPVPALLVEFSKIKKQRSTYGVGLLKHASVLDGRVHTSFKLVRTGRLSSSEPNCQNITAPREPDDEGSWARGCFVAPPGKTLLSLDYSQQELRVAAMLSGDAVMAAAFKSGEDFHKATASLAFGTPIEQVTKLQRSAAKAVNFGLIFGQGAYALGQSLGKTSDEAQAIIDKILGKFRGLAKWRADQVANGRVKGFAAWEWNPGGANLGWAFRRALPGLGQDGDSKEDERTRKHWENVSTNTPIQGIANCFCLASLVELVRWTLEEEPETKVVMTVHDSIVLEVPDADVSRVAAEAKRIMLQWPSGDVPMAVDVETGKDWGHMHAFEVPA